MAKKKIEAPRVATAIPDWVKKYKRPALKRADQGFAPFWDPARDKKQPRQIAGVVSNVRDMPKKKGYQDRRGFDVTAPDGSYRYCVTVSGALKAQGGEDVAAGEFVALEFLGMKKIPGQKNPMKNIVLYREA
jgi:hypothetical protein